MNEVEWAERLSGVESRSRSNTKRLDKVESKQETLEKFATSIQALALKEERTEEDIREIKGDVRKLVLKPGKLWEQVVDKAIMAVLGAALAAAFFKLGLPV